MKKTLRNLGRGSLNLLFLISIFFSIFSLVTANTEDDFIRGIRKNPEQYAVVVSQSLGEGEGILAGEFAFASGIIVVYDTDIETVFPENLIIVGSADKNAKTAELSQPKDEGRSFYVQGSNLFISGSSEENAEHLEEMMLSFISDSPTMDVERDIIIPEKAKTPIFFPILISLIIIFIISIVIIVIRLLKNAKNTRIIKPSQQSHSHSALPTTSKS